ncbi:MAG TPA: cold-shock protein [Planctomycetes bacterium]|nr:cold-shock protein [Planctomycetota bacterium]
MMRGQINRLKTDRGFGFIRSANGEDVFFHRSAVVDNDFDRLREGQEVTFESESSPRGARAKNVKVVA